MSIPASTQKTQTSIPAGVPLIDVHRQFAALKDRLQAAMISVSASGQFILGPEVESLEHELAAYCQTAQAVGCASGSDALLLALMACGNPQVGTGAPDPPGPPSISAP